MKISSDRLQSEADHGCGAEQFPHERQVQSVSCRSVLKGGWLYPTQSGSSSVEKRTFNARAQGREGAALSRRLKRPSGARCYAAFLEPDR